LPLKAAGYVWFGLKIVALVFMLRAIYRMLGHDVPDKVRLWAIPFFIGTPYLIQELHYGNVHLFIVVLAILALYFYETGRETLSTSVLALSISIKVFPVFFLPYFVIRKKFKYVALTLLFVVLFNLLPGFYFGFRENVALLENWFHHVIVDRDAHEFHGGINHSLKGVLQRYLSRVAYEDRTHDQNYQNINLVEWSPEAIQTIWYVAIVVVLCLIGFLCFRRSREDHHEARLLKYGLVACAIVAFAPATGYNYLVMLIFPAIVISDFLLQHRGAKEARMAGALAVASAALSSLPPLLPGSEMQRLMHVYSPYFFCALALFLSCVAALVSLSPSKKHT
jgi:hypothetical protein